MASFPSATKTYTTKTNGQTVDASHVNDLQDEVTAIEGNLRGGSTNQVYVGGATPGYASTMALHRVESSQLQVSGPSTFANLQSGPSTFTGDLTASTIVAIGIPRPIAASTFATSSTSIVDLSTFTIVAPSQLDTLLIEYSVEASTVAINNLRLRNKTDGVSVCDLNDQAGLGDFVAGRSGIGMVQVRMAPSATTKILSKTEMHTSANTRIQQGQVATFVTAWTGTVEYALQGACSTTGGTLRGSYQVRRQPGA